MSIQRKSLFVSALLLLMLAAVPLTAFSQSTFQTSDAISFFDRLPVKGAGSLTRDDDGIWVSVSTSDLDKKSAYTAWWVIFNSPWLCAAGPGACTGADLGAADGSVLHATGFITGTDGTSNFSAHLAEGAVPDGKEVRRGSGLVDSHAAEVHVLVRTHSQSIAGRVDEQTSYLLGACDVNFCDNQQFIVFPPVP